MSDEALAVAAQWEAMGRCYIGAAEGVVLAELLDALADTTLGRLTGKEDDEGAKTRLGSLPGSSSSSPSTPDVHDLHTERHPDGGRSCADCRHKVLMIAEALNYREGHVLPPVAAPEAGTTDRAVELLRELVEMIRGWSLSVVGVPEWKAMLARTDALLAEIDKEV